MKNIRILVIDDNSELIKEINNYFTNHKRIKIVTTILDGDKAIDNIKLHYKDYDLIILDLIIPKRDGLAIAEEIKKLDIDINIIMISSYFSGFIIRSLFNHGINYFMLKPFYMKDLERRILNCYDDRMNYNTCINERAFISKMLHEFGMPSHLKGYKYIRDSILFLYCNYDYDDAILKKIYADLAYKYHTTVFSVERAIRHAIEISFTRGNITLIEELFGYSIDIEKAKPTNLEFIVTLFDKLELEFCVKGEDHY